MKSIFSSFLATFFFIGNQDWHLARAIPYGYPHIEDHVRARVERAVIDPHVQIYHQQPMDHPYQHQIPQYTDNQHPEPAPALVEVPAAMSGMDAMTQVGAGHPLLRMWDNDMDVPIRQQYKQLFEYPKEEPKDLETQLFSKESREKFSGEVDDEGEPVIISHNYKEHKLSQKERQKIFEAPYNLLRPEEAGQMGAKNGYNLYQISSPFRRKDFKLPKDPLILSPQPLAPAAAAGFFEDQVLQQQQEILQVHHAAPVPYVIRPSKSPVAEQARFSDDHDPGVDTSLIHRKLSDQNKLPAARH